MEAQRKHRYRSVLVVGCLLLVAGCELTAAVAQRKRFMTGFPSSRSTAQSPSNTCAVELYAYLGVSSVAKELEAGSDLLTFALDDLCANLVDCLANSDRSDEPDTANETLPSHDAQLLSVSQDL